MYTIGMYIELNKGNIPYSLKQGETYVISTDIQYIYQIGAVVPVIIKGEGCRGLGIIERFVVNKNGGEVIFTFSRTSDEVCKHLYSIYRGHITQSRPDDFEDSVIPGAYRRNQSGKSKQRHAHRMISENPDLPVPPHFGDYDD